GRLAGKPRQRAADNPLRQFQDNEVLRLRLYTASRNGGPSGRQLPQQVQTMNKISVIIVAGGSGTRMGAGIPKQFLPLTDGATILETTLRRFLTALPGCRAVVVLPAAETARWQELCQERGLCG